MAELYLVEFKGYRRGFFYNTYYHDLGESDYVLVEVERGEDIGYVKRKVEADLDFSDRERPGSILRKANDEDTFHLEELHQQEDKYKVEVINIIAKHRLPMKVVDIDCQFDGNKMTIYFTADHRVDFRELVKELAGRYRTRIELRQIGVRDEARRIGGYGICGRPQCCSNFLISFEPISTQHAREQDLPLNPSKISGNCGRLLCCLRYEADMYLKVKSKFPNPGSRVKTKNGDGVVIRIDVFNEEALIRDEENVVFRSNQKDLLEVISDYRDYQVDHKDNNSVDSNEVEELKKLDKDDPSE